MSNERNKTANQAGRRGGPGGGPMAGPAEKAKDFKGTLKKFLGYLGNYKVSILFVIIFAIGSTVLAIFGPDILGKAITEIYTGIMGSMAGTSDGIDFGKVGGILLTLLGIYVISVAFQFVQGYIMSGVANKITYRFRKDIDEKIHRLPLSYYDSVTVGDVLSRITNDVDAISQSLNQSIVQIISSVTTIIGIFIMMLLKSWQMSLIPVITLLTSMAIIMFIFKKSQKHFVNQQKYLGVVNGIIEETYSCHSVVKAFNCEERTLNKFKSETDSLYDSAWKANFLSGLMMPIINIIGNIGFVAVCVLGGYFAASGRISVGDISAFIQYMRTFSQQPSQLSQISNVLQQTMAAAERVFEFLYEEEETPEAENALTVRRNGSTGVEITGEVSFKDIDFGYTDDKIIIKGFNAEVMPGQKIALVGPTGAGKTTIVKLLMRFYDVNSGSISLGGNNIKDFKRDELRSAFGMVLQDTWLYNGTIADNIRYGKLTATDEEVKTAAKIAQADHFISTLPGGYNMMLNEEANNVSEGQKQLLTIARAILADPKILILDEATSSVDTRTEILIQRAMDNLMKGRTSFIIAHRLSTIKNADLILVINGGDIVEQGSHNELLNKGGFYAELYNSQFVKAG